MTAAAPAATPDPAGPRPALPPLAVAPATLAARGLGCRRGGSAVLAAIDLAVAPGEAVIITGANGSGKSSLLAALAGLLPLAAGTLSWGDAPALADPEAHGARLAWLGHTNALKPGRPADRALAETLPPGRATAAARRQGLAALDLAGLADVPVGALSAGQQRRLALARVVASAAPLWLLDEPAAGLDAAARTRVAAVLAAHQARGGLAVIASHDRLPGLAARELVLAAPGEVTA